MTERIEIGEPLFKRLDNLLDEGEHIALLGPRHGGKALILAELARRAKQDHRSQPPKIVRLTWYSSSHETEATFLNWMAEQLEVSVVPNFRQGQRLAAALQELLTLALHRAERPLWIFVQDILGFPNRLARELLMAFQESHSSSAFQRRFSVVVTGGGDFGHLTYGDNSPYRHARPFLVTGMDWNSALAFFCRRRQRQEGKEFQVDEGLAPVLQEVVDRMIVPDAFDLLYNGTGGLPHLLQEVVVTAARHPYTLTPVEIASRWDVRLCSEYLKTFVQVHMGNDYFTRLGLRDIERDPAAFDCLLRVLEDGDGQVALPGDRPHLLELTGVARRDKASKAVISCGIWREFLERNNTLLHQADVFALQGRWSEAWRRYRQSPQSQYARPISGNDATRLEMVIPRWASSLLDNIAKGPEMVCHQFFEGARLLMGFDRVGLFEQQSGKPLWFPPEDYGLSQRDLAQAYEQNAEFRHIGSDDYASYSLNSSRTVLRSTPKLALPWPRGIVPVLYLERRGAGPEVDSSEEMRLPRIFQRFWHAYQTACQIEDEKKIGLVRTHLSEVVKQLNRLLVKDPFDMGEVVHETARLLVEHGGYRRIGICLVDGKRERIQAVASMCHSQEKDFNFHTDFPLNAPALNSDSRQWDIQQKVVLEGTLCIVPDASDSNRTNPKTQSHHCADIGMIAITVVPIRSSETVLGTIHFERMDKEVPPEAEQILFQTLADQIGIIFHQAKRLTLLQESLNVIHSKIVIVNPKRDIVFLNKNASGEDYDEEVDNHCGQGWLPKPFAYESRPIFSGARREDAASAMKNLWKILEELQRQENGDPSHFSHYLLPGNTVLGIPCPSDVSYEWIVSPIDDFRLSLKEPFKANARIGYVEKIYDLTDFYKLLAALKHWLSKESARSTAQAILKYFKAARFRWGRIYLTNRSSDGHRFLYSFEEYGLQSELLHRQFVGGGVTMPEDAKDDPLAWHVINEGHQEAIYTYKAAAATEISVAAKSVIPDRAIQGLPAFICNYRNSRDQKDLEKADLQWIEAPLVIGENVIGKLTVSMLPEDMTLPERWDLFRYAVVGATAALDSALRAEEQQSRVEKVWKETSDMAVHQLSNTIPPAQSFLKYALACLPDQSEEALEHVADAKKCLIKAQNILHDFRRFGSEKPLADFNTYSVPDLLSRVEVHAKCIQAGLHLTTECSTELHQLLVETNIVALLDVAEILVSNSLMHSKKHLHDLSIVIKATCSDPKPESPLPHLMLTFRDNGAGISINMQNRLFAPFNTDHPQGTGLGLAIARRFLRRLGGEISAELRGGEGACFVIQLPFYKRVSQS